MVKRPAEMVLAVQQLQLHGGTAALVAGDQIAKLAQDISANLLQVNTREDKPRLTLTMFSWQACACRASKTVFAA